MWGLRATSGGVAGALDGPSFHKRCLPYRSPGRQADKWALRRALVGFGTVSSSVAVFSPCFSCRQWHPMCGAASVGQASGGCVRWRCRRGAGGNRLVRQRSRLPGELPHVRHCSSRGGSFPWRGYVSTHPWGLLRLAMRLLCTLRTQRWARWRWWAMPPGVRRREAAAPLHSTGYSPHKSRGGGLTTKDKKIHAQPEHPSAASAQSACRRHHGGKQEVDRNPAGIVPTAKLPAFVHLHRRSSRRPMSALA